MTSLSRRKRRTTRPNTPRQKGAVRNFARRAAAIALTASIGLAAGGVSPAYASESATSTVRKNPPEQAASSGVVTASSTAAASRTGAASNANGAARLQWKPRRPGQRVVETTPASRAPITAQLVQAVEPRIDPFEELVPRRPLEAAAVEPSVEPSSQPATEPTAEPTVERFRETTVETVDAPIGEPVESIRQPILREPSGPRAEMMPARVRLAPDQPDAFSGAGQVPRRTIEESGAEALADFRAHRIDSISLDIAVQGGPGNDIPDEFELPTSEFSPRMWGDLPFLWHASELSHKPLYFEEVALERYGHSWGPLAQPVISSAHFFATLPVLPYKMGLEPPNECIYALGYYRPGACAPQMIDPIPISVRAALFEAGALVGGVVAIP